MAGLMPNHRQEVILPAPLQQLHGLEGPEGRQQVLRQYITPRVVAALLQAVQQRVCQALQDVRCPLVHLRGRQGAAVKAVLGLLVAGVMLGMVRLLLVVDAVGAGATSTAPGNLRVALMMTTAGVTTAGPCLLPPLLMEGELALPWQLRTTISAAAATAGHPCQLSGQACSGQACPSPCCCCCWCLCGGLSRCSAQPRHDAWH